MKTGKLLVLSSITVPTVFQDLFDTVTRLQDIDEELYIDITSLLDQGLHLSKSDFRKDCERRLLDVVNKGDFDMVLSKLTPRVNFNHILQDRCVYFTVEEYGIKDTNEPGEPTKQIRLTKLFFYEEVG